ncbi:family 43 glycosylhydrolase [Flavobacterium sp.]|uniref:family 43 glycosylhydrolase n=1 Tax=Flavobacterium sp. TaxID=239 RepID=UPI00121054D5|nr:family 43 glycosylhydrolase [Flavobacterium sp.]RZJ73825.1 MAG: glycoside hydrolase [Flavobacterium sp.]
MKKFLLHTLLVLTVFPTAIFAQRTFAEKDFSGYLFAYFTGNKVEEEALRFAVSPDGFKFYALNANNAILDSRKISETGGIRDPHILRGEDGLFYMVMTDMTSNKGWNSNRGMILSKSSDLVNWTSSKINIQKRFPNNENLQRVWAPQTIFDAKAGKYLVYFSMKHGDNFDKIYYAYANKDFTDLESEPKILFLPKSKKASIDGDIILKDGIYHLFYKTEEGKKGIKTATTSDLTSGNWIEQDDYKQQTNEAVEGSGVFKLNHSNEYVLMYDVYMKGQYQFTKSSDLEHFSVIDHEISMDFHPRHGTIIPVKRSELKALFAKWGKPADYPEIANNPVLEGFYADPEILYSNKTNKFYLYPTSDGFQSWSGDFFEVFSSDNLVDWKNEGKILDLKADVPWGNRNAWAPTAIEKKTNGKYQYFYYFTAAQKIGVAVADNPFGPFKDSGKALIDQKPNGVSGGQNIDPDVFTDPKTGKSYLYWGNGFMAVAELNADMVSIKPNSVKVIEVDKTFREGTEVFYRNGTYYFMWSEDDTRSPNYKVRYGTSKSPLGPIEISSDSSVIEKSESDGILATGHNSVINVPGTDDWYIVYHRFNIPNGAKMGDAAGFHREVCIDKMTFSKDGKIEKITPTLNGIAPVSIPKNNKK